MKLLSFSTSPFARKVRIAAIEVGVANRIEVIDANPFAADGVVSGANPLGKIPALILADRTLVDSPLICAYLDTLHDGAKLHPAGDWHTLQVQALGDGMMDATVLRRLETQRPESLRSAHWIARYEAAVHRTVSELASAVGGLGERVTIGAISLYCALGYLDLRYAELDWRRAHPDLASWFERWSARPSARATAPPAGHPGAAAALRGDAARTW
jgi:glutathione S-transferase